MIAECRLKIRHWHSNDITSAGFVLPIFLFHFLFGRSVGVRCRCACRFHGRRMRIRCFFSAFAVSDMLVHLSDITPSTRIAINSHHTHRKFLSTIDRYMYISLTLTCLVSASACDAYALPHSSNECQMGRGAAQISQRKKNANNDESHKHNNILS